MRLTLLLLLPNLLWLAHHGFPFLEFERHSRQSGSRILRGPVSLLVDQARIMNPVLAPLGLFGVGWFFTKGGKALRLIGIAALFVVLLLLSVQAHTAIFANDYGQEAAINLFSPRYGLPASISKAQTYWLWGSCAYDGRARSSLAAMAGEIESTFARSKLLES